MTLFCRFRRRAAAWLMDDAEPHPPIFRRAQVAETDSVSCLAQPQRKYKSRVVSLKSSFVLDQPHRYIHIFFLTLRPLNQPPSTPYDTFNPLTMKFMTTLAALFLSASTVTLAAPVDLAARDVWVPKILYPTDEVIWHVGESYNVEWALDEEPASVTNPIGTVLLSKNGLLDIGA